MPCLKKLGGVITQGNMPMAFSNKLTETQKSYIVTKIELLTIIETLKQFIGMLWGHIIKFTDKKLICLLINLGLCKYW